MKNEGKWSQVSHVMTTPRIFLGVFLYVLLLGLLLQKFILPLTPWHAGHGLLAGGDWVSFHAIADKLATLIEESGWMYWQLRPEGQAPAGIASALYVLFGIHEPWVVLPVNAALYATSAVLLWHSMMMLTRKPTIALAALLPMLLFPSTAMIWGQIHKDVWALTGAMGLAWGLVCLSQAEVSLKTCVKLVTLAIVCTLLIWVVRPYANKIFFAACALGVVVLMLITRPRGVIWWLAAGSFLLAQATVNIFIAQTQASITQTQAPERPCDIWQQSPPIPLLDNQLGGLACAREGFRHGYPDAGSNIDTEVGFRNARDIVAYMPRALQIVLFSPFPTMWGMNAQQPGGAVMRLLVIPEMILYYLALAGCVLAAVKAQPRERATIVALVLFFLFVALTYALVVTNIGTLYRMRYPTMLLLLALGMWGWSLLLQRNVKHVHA